MTDAAALGLFASLLLASVGAGEGLRALGWRPESSRRAVHVGVGLTVAASPVWFSGPGAIYALAVAFAVGNAVALHRRWIPSMHAIERPSWGTVVFPVALVAALALSWGPLGRRVWAMQIAFAVLALADPAASWVGQRNRRGGAGRCGAGKCGEGKSRAGSLAFAAVAAVVSGAGLAAWTEASPLAVIASAFSVSFLATVAEALGRRGWDNLWIVLAVLVGLRWWEAPSASVALGLGAVAGALAFAWATARVGVLTASGALAGSLLAWGLIAEWQAGWWAPALAFFVLSSALSRAGTRRKAQAQAQDQKGSRRDAAQVLANGGVGMALLAASLYRPGSEVLAWAFVGSFGAAAADTWATEIGTWVRGRTRWLGVGREVPAGTSGGMSLAGTLASLAGASSVAVPAALAMPGVPSGAVPALVAAATVGAFTDTALGATVQARYRRPDGSATERPEADGAALPLARGLRWVDNDVVNGACTLAGAAGGALAWMVLA